MIVTLTTETYSYICVYSMQLSVFLCVCHIHLHLSSLPWSSRFSSLSRSIFYTVLTTVDQNLHHIQRLRVCAGLNGETHISHSHV